MKGIIRFQVASLLITFLASCAPATPATVEFAVPTPRTSATPSLPTATPTLVPQTPTAALPTVMPTSIPTSTPPPLPTIPPGLYVTSLRTDPNPPLRGTELMFYATFLNTTGTVQNYKWIVYIYRPDNFNTSVGETTRTETGILLGSSESKSLGNWKTPVGGPCENYIARVAFFDQSDKAIMFAAPDGKIFQQDFRICALVDLPNYPTVTPVPPQPTPTMGPGLFAIDLRIQPDPPTRVNDLNFIVTFANTTGNPQTLKWVVYIYRPGERNSFGQTTGATTTFPSAIEEAQSAGYWKLSGGGPCEDFVARAAWFDQENKTNFFTTFDLQVFEKPFTVCP
jgi:hypothetical protein